MSQEKIFQFRRRFDSLYWQQFLLTAGMVLLTLLLLGVSFYGLSYNDTVTERRSEMRQHAELIANMSGDYLASNGQTQSPSLQNLVALAAGLTKADFLLCNQEGYALLTSDQRLGGKVVSVPQDIQDATGIARNMVAMFGMSDEFGMMALASRRSQYLDGGYGIDCAQDTAAAMDRAVRDLIDACYKKAVEILSHSREDMDKVVEYAHRRNPNLKIFPISAKSGLGVDAWRQWLLEETEAWKKG